MKSEQVLPLPTRSEMGFDLNDLSYSQYLHYVSQTNYKNLWKEAQKKFSAAYRPSINKTRSNQKPASAKEILRTLLNRIYSSPVISLDTDSVHQPTGQLHDHILPSLAIFECDCHFLIVSEHAPFSVHQCLSLSPAMLSLDSVKPMFVLFQLLHAVKQLQDQSLFMEGILWHHIFIDDTLHIKVLPAVQPSLVTVEPTLRAARKELKLQQLTMSWVLLTKC